MTAPKDVLRIHKAKSIFGCHWRKDEAIQQRGAVGHIKPAKPKEVKSHRFIADHARAIVDDVYMKDVQHAGI